MKVVVVVMVTVVVVVVGVDVVEVGQVLGPLVQCWHS